MRDGQFYLSDGSTVTIPMMSQEHNFNYTEGSNYQAIELPYDGNQLSMVALLPTAGQFSQFESSLTSQQLNNIIAKMQDSKVDLTMPKFTIESSFDLNATLGNLGINDAFDSTKGDFSGNGHGAKDLFIGDVVHKAYVSADESGPASRCRQRRDHDGRSHARGKRKTHNHDHRPTVYLPYPRYTYRRHPVHRQGDESCALRIINLTRRSALDERLIHFARR